MHPGRIGAFLNERLPLRPELAERLGEALPRPSKGAAVSESDPDVEGRPTLAIHDEDARPSPRSSPTY